MTCEVCKAWCVTSEKQLANRLRNKRNAPDVGLMECPVCKGTDWATSRERILPARQSWWRRLLGFDDHKFRGKAQGELE